MSWKQNTLFLILVVAVTSFFSSSATAEKKIDQHSSTKQNTGLVPIKHSSKKIEMDLPSPGDKGKPEIKITVGGARGGSSNLELSVFIPEDHIVLSSKPILKWEISEPTNYPIRFSLVDESTEPLIDTIIKYSASAGLHYINLKNHSASLKPGVDYQWSLQICSDRNCKNTARNIVARAGFSFEN